MSKNPFAVREGAVRLGLARERQGPFATEMSAGVSAVAQEWGWSVTRVDDAAGERQCDVILAIGNAAIYPNLVVRPRSSRRVLWYVEPLLRRSMGNSLHRRLPTGRMLDLLGGVAPAALRTRLFRQSRETAAMVREPVANLNQLRRHAASFDRIVVDSRERAAAAAEIGLDVEVVPLGYHEAFAGPILAGGERTLDVLFMGHFVGRLARRQRLLDSVQGALRGRGVDVTVVTDELYGAERRQMLESTRVVLDVHRIPGNLNGHRFILASAAGAAIVGEPINNPWPLRPGTHYLECEIDEMAEQVTALLHDEPLRQRLVQGAHELLRTEMSMKNVLPRVLGV